MNRERRIHEMFFDKDVWMKRVNYLITGFVLIPLVIKLVTATKCEFQKYVVRNEEGVYAKRSSSN